MDRLVPFVGGGLEAFPNLVQSQYTNFMRCMLSKISFLSHACQEQGKGKLIKWRTNLEMRVRSLVLTEPLMKVRRHEAEEVVDVALRMVKVEYGRTDLQGPEGRQANHAIELVLHFDSLNFPRRVCRLISWAPPLADRGSEVVADIVPRGTIQIPATLPSVGVVIVFEVQGDRLQVLAGFHQIEIRVMTFVFELDGRNCIALKVDGSNAIEELVLLQPVGEPDGAVHYLGGPLTEVDDVDLQYDRHRLFANLMVD